MYRRQKTEKLQNLDLFSACWLRIRLFFVTLHELTPTRSNGGSEGVGKLNDKWRLTALRVRSFEPEKFITAIGNLAE